MLNCRHELSDVSHYLYFLTSLIVPVALLSPYINPQSPISLSLPDVTALCLCYLTVPASLHFLSAFVTSQLLCSQSLPS